MAITKSSVPINFAKGLDLKSDPFQVAPGNFLQLQNTVFTKAGLLAKRNGFQTLPALPTSDYTYLTTFKNNLTAIGTNLAAFAQGPEEWVVKGHLQPVKLSVLPVVRNNLNQIQVDSVNAPNNTTCLVYNETNGTTVTPRYAIVDTVTGQSLVAPTTIPTGSAGAPTGGVRVFLLGAYFIIVFTTASNHIQFIAISYGTLAVALSNTDIATAYAGPTSNLAWDGSVIGTNLAIAYNTTSGGQAVKIVALNSNLSLSSTQTVSSAQGTLINLTTDNTAGSPPRLYVSFYSPTSTNGYTAIYDQNLNQSLAPVETIVGVANILNLASTASGGSISGGMTLFYEISNQYGYLAVNTNYISKNTMSVRGTVGTPAIVIRDLGLASKAFTMAKQAYFVGIQSSALQPTYFLINGTLSTSASPVITAKLAYSNGASTYYTEGLPSVSISGTNVQFAYFYADLIQAISKTTVVGQATENTGGIYSQTGVNIASVTYTSSETYSSEVANNLHLSGGYLTMYDGYKPVEHGFHLWPEYVAGDIGLSSGVMSPQQYYYQAIYTWSDNQGNIHRSAPSVPTLVDLSSGYNVTYTGSLTAGSTAVTLTGSLGVVPGLLRVGQLVFDSTTAGNLPPNTTIASIVDATHIILSNAATATAASDVLSFPGARNARVATFGSGATTLNVGTAGASSFQVGQTITDLTTPSTIPANTLVTAQASSSTITISNATTAASGTNETVTVPVGIAFVGTYVGGSTTITTTGATGALVGQVITDTTTPSNFNTPTYITAVNGNTLTISSPTNAAGTSHNLLTQTVFSTNVYVPTLRLTEKVSNPVKIEIYRWSVAQQIYYEVTSITSPLLNDPTVDYVVFTDTQSDQQILGNQILYTTGGVVEDIGAPACNVLTLFDTRLWLVDAEDPNLLWYSKQVIENVPVEMSDLFTLYISPTTAAQFSTGPITALSVMDDKLIIFKDNAIYYINGTGPDNTGANSQYSQPVFITSTVGCTDQSSIVFMPSGLMFQSDKGIWLLDRNLQTTYIGAPVETLTTGATVESALNIPETNQVRFTLSSGITLMYDYFFQQWGSFTGLSAASSTLYESAHTFISAQGLVFQETPNVYQDGSNPVCMNFTTGWMSLAGLQGFERAYFFYLLGNYLSPHKLQVSISYDFAASPSQSVIIAPINYSPAWGAAPGPWGGTPSWGGAGSIEQWRVFMSQQKCQSFQITIQEIFDPSFGTPPGAGLTLSGLNLIVGAKRAYRTQNASTSTG